MPIALGALALLPALRWPGRRRRAPEPLPPKNPNFVVIQTDDQTLDGLYATYRLPRRRPDPGDAEHPRPDRQTRDDLQPLLRLLPPLLPLPGQPADRALCPQQQRQREHPAQGGYTGFLPQAITHNLAVWLQQGGYRTIHIGKFLNGYGDEPYDNGNPCRPAGDSWHTVLNADTNHYFYGYTLNNNGNLEGPFGDSGSWDTREYGVRDDIGCPFAPTNGLPCYYETDWLTGVASREILETPAEKPFYLQLDYTAPHGDFRRPAGPEPAPATTTGSRARGCHTTAQKASTRATSPTSPASSAKPNT